MTFDHQRQELTGWLNRRASERWQEDVKKAIPPIYNAWLQAKLHGTPGLQPGEDVAFPKDIIYDKKENLPEEHERRTGRFPGRLVAR